MSDTKRGIITKANTLLAEGNTEGFLQLFAEDVTLTLVAGEPKLVGGRDAIREFMRKSTKEGAARTFTLHSLIADGDSVISNGDAAMPGKDSENVPFANCEIDKFRDGLIAELLTLMAKIEGETQTERSAAA